MNASQELFDPSNFPHDSRSGVVVAAVASCLSITFTAVALRLYTRIILIQKFGIDDILALISFICAVGIGAVDLANTPYLGHHFWDLRLDEIATHGMLIYSSLILYNVGLLFAKMTFLFQYYRVFREANQMRRVYIVSMYVVGGWSSSQILVAIFTCNPVAGFWDWFLGAKCLNWNGPLIWGVAIGNILTDLIIFFVPLPAVFKLKISRAQKCVLVVVFSLGLVTCVITIGRISSLHGDLFDATYKNVDLVCWTFAEVCSAITCAALATLKPLLNRISPGQRRQEARESGSTATLPVEVTELPWERPSGACYPARGDSLSPTQMEESDIESASVGPTIKKELPSPNSPEAFRDPFHAPFNPTPPLPSPTTSSKHFSFSTIYEEFWDRRSSGVPLISHLHSKFARTQSPV